MDGQMPCKDIEMVAHCNSNKTLFPQYSGRNACKVFNLVLAGSPFNK